MQDKTDDPKKTSKPAYKPQIIESQQVSGEGKAEDANSRIASTAFINDVSQHAIPPPVKRSKLNRILWLLVLVSAVPIGLILGVFAFLTILASRGASGTELMALGLLPIIIVLPYVLPLSIIASLALLFRVKRSSQRIALIIFVATFGYMLVIASPLLMDNREFNKSLSIQETIKLINECKLSEVIKTEDKKVDISYVDDEYGTSNSRPHYADAKGYPEYVKAIKAVQSQCDNKITYQNHVQSGDSDDLSWDGDRWISRLEAIDYITQCKVEKVLYFIDEYDPEYWRAIEKGQKTDIALRENKDGNDFGDIWLYPSQQQDDQIAELVKNSSSRCGFEINTI